MLHVPLPQEAVAFVRAQPMPQAPQSVVVRSEVSQPFASRPSQSPLPVTHVPMRHTIVLQSATAPARTHAIPQEPQSVVERSEVSHPFETSPSQSAHPASHITISHVPVAHDPVACTGAQGMPHPPQLIAVLTRVSQPLPVMPSQLPYPGTQSVSVQGGEQEATPFG
jgi:hypothetical protein